MKHVIFCRGPMALVLSAGALLGCAAPAEVSPPQTKSRPAPIPTVIATPTVIPTGPRPVIWAHGQTRAWAFSPDGRHFAVGWRVDSGSRYEDIFGVVRLYNVATSKIEAEWRVKSPTQSLAMAGPNWLIMADGFVVRVWDWRKKALVKTLENENSYGMVATSPDNRLLFSPPEIYRVGSWKKISELRSDSATDVGEAVFSANGSRVFTIARDSSPMLAAYDTRSGRKIWDKGFEVAEAGVSWSPQHLVLVQGDRGLLLFKESSGKLARVLSGNADEYVVGSFVDGGKRLAILTDRRLRLISTRTGKELQSFPVSEKTTNVLSPDGRALAEISRHGTIQFVPSKLKLP